MAEEAASLRVLIVEDNPTNLVLAEAVLRLSGFLPAVARSAEELIESLAGPLPDLILMDVQLPGQDGLVLTRALKADPATAAIPIVALTAHAMPTDREKALAAGCAGYIPKPINTRTLAAELRGILRAARGEAELNGRP